VPLFADIGFWGYFVNGVLILLSLLLILIVLIQRGKGGGLAGAFGGAGGSSAFGSRAGDTFTKVTLYMAGIWVLVIMINVKVMLPPKKAAPAEPAKVEQPAEQSS
jgi:preprotein translocase subunit SecG